MKSKESPPRPAARTTRETRKTSPEKKRVEFRFHAPEATDVLVAGSFSAWTGRAMRKDEEGTWRAGITLPPGIYQYRFIVDGEWRDDPGCPDRVPNDKGGENCVVNVASRP